MVKMERKNPKTQQYLQRPSQLQQMLMEMGMMRKQKKVVMPKRRRRRKRRRTRVAQLIMLQGSKITLSSECLETGAQASLSKPIHQQYQCPSNSLKDHSLSVRFRNMIEIVIDTELRTKNAEPKKGWLSLITTT